ncbi:MAG: hypothetical protein M9949_10080 [Candidatus Kapabacteria bacterium]|nr:hypothetical protein [Candidatus Kapabacteria bacterium]
MINIKKCFISASIGILLIFMANSCCECPLEPYDAPIICKVREVTITEFNPGINQIDDTTFVPVPEYSIHTYQFPSSDLNSGILPNDERFADSEVIALATEPFEDSPYSAVILDTYPINKDLKGDMMVVSADPVNLRALLRFKGSLQRINPKFLSENANEFCDYIENNETQINAALADLKEYGKGLVGSEFISYNSTNIDVIDANGRIVTNQDGVPFPSQNMIDKLLNSISEEAVNILVEIGDVFVYKAIDGKFFVFVIADVSQGTFEPRKRRVTIMFNRIG